MQGAQLGGYCGCSGESPVARAGAGRLVLVFRQPLRRASLPPSQPSLTHTFTRPGI